MSHTSRIWFESENEMFLSQMKKGNQRRKKETTTLWKHLFHVAGSIQRSFFGGGGASKCVECPGASAEKGPSA